MCSHWSDYSQTWIYWHTVQIRIFGRTPGMCTMFVQAKSCCFLLSYIRFDVTFTKWQSISSTSCCTGGVSLCSWRVMFFTVQNMTSVVLEEQFRCCICLDVYTDPVSIPCGHNFCLDCIEGFWDTKDQSECPLCKETFKSRPDLRINRGFADVIEFLKRLVFFFWRNRWNVIDLNRDLTLFNPLLKASVGSKRGGCRCCGPSGRRALWRRRSSLWHLQRQQGAIGQVVPGLSAVLLRHPPHASPEGPGAAEAPTDGPGHLPCQPPLQEPQQAADHVLQEGPDAGVYEVRWEEPQEPQCCPLESGRQEGQGEQKVKSSL